MKNKFIFILFIFLSFNSLSQSTDHVGTWVGMDDDVEVAIVFDAKGYVTFLAEGEVYGGIPKRIEDEEIEWVTYSMDYSTMPFTLQFTSHIIYEGEEEEETELMFGVFEFQENKTKIRICLNFEEEGPLTEFDENESMILTKAK